jgi:hypothetical protein
MVVLIEQNPKPLCIVHVGVVGVDSVFSVKCRWRCWFVSARKGPIGY